MKPFHLFIAISLLACSCGTLHPGRPTSDGDEMVNTGYGSTHRDAVTGAISKVTPDNTIQAYSNIYDYLRGRVPGVTIVGKSIRIRGVGTPNGNPEPLILVDGVETDDISDLNPGDIQSVEVLKDGSASIYGVRSANGVILITTRQK